VDYWRPHVGCVSRLLACAIFARVCRTARASCFMLDYRYQYTFEFGPGSAVTIRRAGLCKISKTCLRPAPR
jgi:hypothetical protein